MSGNEVYKFSTPTRQKRSLSITNSLGTSLNSPLRTPSKGKLKKSVQRENGEREPEALSEEKANVPATPDRRRRQKLKQSELGFF